MPVLRQNLVRLCFFCTSRSLRTSTVLSARGMRPRNTNQFDEGDFVPEFSQPSRSSFAETRPQRAFDMGRFTDAVRGDLRTDEEQRHFKEQKPIWLKAQQTNDRRRQEPVDMEDEPEIDWPEDPRKGKLVDKPLKEERKKKIHKAVYRPREDVEEEEEDGTTARMQSGFSGGSMRQVTRPFKTSEWNDNVKPPPELDRNFNRKQMSRGRAEENDAFDENDNLHYKGKSANHRKFNNRVEYGEVTQRSSPRERSDTIGMTKEEYLFTKRNKQFNDYQPSRDEHMENELEYDKSQQKKKRHGSSGPRTPAAEREDGTDDGARFSQDPNAEKAAGSDRPMPALRGVKDNDKVFKNAVIQTRNRKNRMKNRKILLEGVRLINDALDAGLKVHTVFACSPELVRRLSKDALKMSQPEQLQVSQKQMSLWSEMVTPPGIMAIADMPDTDNMERIDSMPLTVVLDNIRDPGNMGAVIRVLAGAGCEQLIATENCTDPWDSKVLRAGSGGHFHMPIQYNVPWNMVANYLEDNATVFLADNVESASSDSFGATDGSRTSRRKDVEVDLDTAAYHQVDMAGGSVVLIIGGETHGISQEARALMQAREGVRLVIPMGNKIESLNAASAVAVLAFEMKRQRLLRGVDDDEVSQSEGHRTA
ncbi:rRNA methyltransferase 3, mitochondrial-like [Paramacrobiotus metropolitanus]|uniref:rRNA methyltransferase 3, mitochondrial-like n=1 Tax=Paramacrobiotus metropolitanus TaxID=2943436 RepID=UPI002446323E|nr:rRNA methyltransferase 3, mitochondrial-like [Paramacrobiotus metropolitanus]